MPAAGGIAGAHKQQPLPKRPPGTWLPGGTEQSAKARRLAQQRSHCTFQTSRRLSATGVFCPKCTSGDACPFHDVTGADFCGAWHLAQATWQSEWNVANVAAKGFPDEENQGDDVSTDSGCGAELVSSTASDGSDDEAPLWA